MLASGLGGTVEIRDAQRRAWDNKVTKGFNTTDVPLEFGLLTAEVGEAFTAWRKRLPDFGEELADVAIYLDAAIKHKLTKNAGRVYQRDPHGIPTRIAESPQPPTT